MWLNILSSNFKELLEILKTKPFVIIVIALMFLAGFFINKWAISKDESVSDLKAKDEEYLKVTNEKYKYKYEAHMYKQLYYECKTSTDSLFQESAKILRTNLNTDKNE